jgi:hypothetical protein
MPRIRLLRKAAASMQISLCATFRSVERYLSLDAVSYVYRQIWWNVGQESFVSVSMRFVTRRHKSKHSNKSVNNNNKNYYYYYYIYVFTEL